MLQFLFMSNSHSTMYRGKHFRKTKDHLTKASQNWPKVLYHLRTSYENNFSLKLSNKENHLFLKQNFKRFVWKQKIPQEKDAVDLVAFTCDKIFGVEFQFNTWSREMPNNVCKIPLVLVIRSPYAAFQNRAEFYPCSPPPFFLNSKSHSSF